MALNFTPFFDVPVNPNQLKLTAVLNNSVLTKTFKESIENTFHIQLGITYSF